MASKIDKVRAISLEADTATLLEADAYAVKLIQELNNVTGKTLQQIIKTGKFQVDADGRIKLSVQNIASLERSVGALTPYLDAGVATVAASTLSKFSQDSVRFGAKVFEAQMRAVGQDFAFRTVPLLEKVAQARQIIYAKSLVGQANANVQSAILGAFRDRVNLADLPGIIQAESGVNESLARTIARSETFANYRTANTALAEAQGFEYYEYMGPMDDTTSEVCAEQIGKIRTRDEWLAIHDLIFEYGLHPNCRHSLVAVEKDWMSPEEWDAATSE